MCASVRPEPIAVVVELLLEYRSEYLRYCLLHKSVYHRWHSEFSCPALWFWYLHPADWLRLIFPCPQLLPDAFAVFRKVCAKLFHGHPVHPCRSFVPYDLQVRGIEIILVQYLLHETTCVHALFPFCPFCLCRL